MAGNIRIKKIKKGNIFDVRNISQQNSEIFEKIISSNGIKIERIVSSGQVTAPGKWLQEKTDEWVILLKGKSVISFFEGYEIELKRGDYLFIQSGTKHRVTFTSKKPECVWLAIHGKLTA